MTRYSRREAISAGVSFIAASVIPAESPERKQPEAYADAAAADKWVQAWAESKRSVAGALILRRFADPVYIVTKEIMWVPNPPETAHHKPVTVTAGFVTDFASIPRIFWSALRPDGDYGYAAIVHDYLYWMQPVERKTADEILRLAMQDFAVNDRTVEAIYRAVRLGGNSAWGENARLKSWGEKRVLKRYPDDPTIRWADWKRRPDVF